MSSVPEGWSTTTLGELFNTEQIQMLVNECNAKTLTQARIRAIIDMDTSKMEGTVDPTFMMYKLMHEFGVT